MLEPQYKDNAEQAAGKLGAAGQRRMHAGVRACWGRQDFASKGTFSCTLKNVAGSPANFEFMSSGVISFYHKNSWFLS